MRSSKLRKSCKRPRDSLESDSEYMQIIHGRQRSPLMLQDLPDAILLNIFQRLNYDTFALLCTIGHASHRLRRMAFSSQLWRGIDFVRFKSFEEILHILSHLHGTVHFLELSLQLLESERISASEVAIWKDIALRLGSRMTSLKFVGDKNRTWIPSHAASMLLVELLFKARSLTMLDIPSLGQDFTPEFFRAIRALPLKEFCYGYNYRTPYNSPSHCCALQFLLPNLPCALTSLSLQLKEYGDWDCHVGRSCPDQSEVWLDTLFEACPNLSSLCIAGAPGSSCTLDFRVLTQPICLNVLSLSNIRLQEGPDGAFDGAFLKCVKEWRLEKVAVTQIEFTDSHVQSFSLCPTFAAKVTFKKCPHLSSVGMAASVFPTIQSSPTELVFQECVALQSLHNFHPDSSISISYPNSLRECHIANPRVPLLRTLSSLTTLSTSTAADTFSFFNRAPFASCLTCLSVCWPTSQEHIVVSLRHLKELYITGGTTSLYPQRCSLTVGSPHLGKLVLTAIDKSRLWLEDIDLSRCIGLESVFISKRGYPAGTAKWLMDLVTLNPKLRLALSHVDLEDKLRSMGVILSKDDLEDLSRSCVSVLQRALPEDQENLFSTAWKKASAE
mmetsp:Transcript_32394/g.52405  ORF Transcript_32394/g.52405 Transcript_32394/m.52405 type:complete len:613 (-) Transcript_32394:39-1877(-)